MLKRETNRHKNPKRQGRNLVLAFVVTLYNLTRFVNVTMALGCVIVMVDHLLLSVSRCSFLLWQLPISGPRYVEDRILATIVANS